MTFASLGREAITMEYSKKKRKSDSTKFSVKLQLRSYLIEK
jgi:hypothetical protein